MWESEKTMGAYETYTEYIDEVYRAVSGMRQAVSVSKPGRDDVPTLDEMQTVLRTSEASGLPILAHPKALKWAEEIQQVFLLYTKLVNIRERIDTKDADSEAMAKLLDLWAKALETFQDASRKLLMKIAIPR